MVLKEGGGIGFVLDDDGNDNHGGVNNDNHDDKCDNNHDSSVSNNHSNDDDNDHGSGEHVQDDSSDELIIILNMSNIIIEIF